MHKGSCLCGAVKYEIDGELGPINLCHCSKCRKANGSAFLAASLVKKADLRIVSGSDHLAEYESGPGVGRVFCKTCASPLYSRRDAMPEAVRLRIGTLDTPIDGKPVAHIFVGSKAEWFDIHDDAPQYAERP
jgi:hypothetical protein